ncbi:MAG: methyltransferase domain-containing protein [Alphaproteobacteria bacterium]
MAWNPDQYLFFSDHRIRPALDLLNAIPPIDAKHVVDLGCGTGSILPYLQKRWPDATLTAVDQSPDMLSKAGQTFAGADFVQSDIAAWQPNAAVDVIFSNAALNWLDCHETLLFRLIGFLRPGGSLAIQMPRNHDRPSHTAVSDIIEQEPYAAALRPLLKPAPVHPPAWYVDVLSRLRQDGASVDIWETDYQQILQGENPVAEWTKGTYLRPFLDALSGTDKTRFETSYRHRILDAYPPMKDGATLFAFRRLFMVVTLKD